MLDDNNRDNMVVNEHTMNLSSIFILEVIDSFAR